MHALEVVALQDRQLGALQERLTATMGKLVVATSQVRWTLTHAAFRRCWHHGAQQAVC